MTDEVECPFDDPAPPGRKTMPVPAEIRNELKDLHARQREFSSKTIARDPSRRGNDESFGAYYRTSSAIMDGFDYIEINVLKRPVCARVAYHADWLYSIETPEILAKEAAGPARRVSVIEELITAFGSKGPRPWPFKEKAPAGLELFDVPIEVRGILQLAREREKAAAKLVGDYGNTNDGGMWFRRHTIADALEYIANDHVRAVYEMSDRYNVIYYADFKCAFNIT